MNRSRIFVIIVTYNAMPWIDRCFLSLRRSSVPLIPVVVDNGSLDCTVACIQCNYPEVKVLVNETNQGFGRANNLGIRYALDHGAEYLFLLNQDAWIFEETISRILAAYTTDYAILGPVHLEKTASRIEGNFTDFTPKSFLMNLLGDSLSGCLRQVYEVPFTSAAAWLLPRATLERVGGFDPLFFHYGEDNNYCHRVLYHGLKIGIVPTAKICHDTRRNGFLHFPGRNERSLQLYYMNPNHSWSDIQHYKKSCCLKMLKSLLKGQISFFCQQRNAFRKVEKQTSLIFEHRSINQTVGMHWL